MSQHRRRRTALAITLPLALTAAGAWTYGSLLGSSSYASAAPPASVPAWATATADGFASVNALGQNGTYGGRGGQIADGPPR